jgi:hypothetical protein
MGITRDNTKRGGGAAHDDQIEVVEDGRVKTRQPHQPVVMRPARAKEELS